MSALPPPPPPFSPQPPPAPQRRKAWPWVLGAVGVAALVLVTAVVVLVVVVVHHVSDAVSTLPMASSAPATGSPQPGSTTTPGPTSATDAARASAISFVEEAVPRVLAYDSRSFAAHVDEAARLMTPTYAASFRATSAGLGDAMSRVSATVTATVSGAGLAGIEGDRAQVLVFVDQRTERNGGIQTQPSTATVSLQRSNGSWLIDDLGVGTLVSHVAESDPTRRAIIAAATQEASALINLDYAVPDAARGAVLAGATGDFARQFSAGFPTLARSLRKLRTVTTGEVTAAGVAAYDAGSATVLVSTTGTTRSAVAGPAPLSYRLQLTLVPVDGRWLVSELTKVG